MILLIDGDTPAYAAAAVCEDTDEQNAIWEANKTIERLLVATGTQSFKLFLTGTDNFRYAIFPEYKANRIKTPRPKHLAAVRESLVRSYGAIISQGCEADDLLGIEQVAASTHGTEETMICSIDKDLDQIPGWHYHPGIKRQGVWIREPRRYLVTPAEALHFFYYQLLIGDSTDGIKGAVGIGKAKAEKILEGCTTAEDYYHATSIFFSCEEELLLNARCLYIWQKENDTWMPPS